MVSRLLAGRSAGYLRHLLIAAVLAFSWAAMAHAGLGGSAHDFSGETWSGGSLCEPCHTPHDADSTLTEAPLWNHEFTTQVFTPYDSPTMAVPVGQPRTYSKLCLSCHDGSVALDSFGGASGSDYIGAAYDLDNDLSDDHPVSIQWAHQTVGGTCSTCHCMVWDPDLGALITRYCGLPMYAGYLECSSCHDVHNSESLPDLLLRSSSGSEICLVCHDK